MHVIRCMPSQGPQQEIIALKEDPFGIRNQLYWASCSESFGWMAPAVARNMTEVHVVDFLGLRCRQWVYVGRKRRLLSQRPRKNDAEIGLSSKSSDIVLFSFDVYFDQGRGKHRGRGRWSAQGMSMGSGQWAVGRCKVSGQGQASWRGQLAAVGRGCGLRLDITSSPQRSLFFTRDAPL